MAEENSGSAGLKAMSGILAIVAIIGGVAAVVMPMQQQINMLHEEVSVAKHHMGIAGHPLHQTDKIKSNSERLERVEQRTKDQIILLDTKLQQEIARAIEVGALNDQRQSSEVEQLKEWQKWWYREVQPVDIEQNRRIDILETMNGRATP